MYTQNTFLNSQNNGALHRGTETGFTKSRFPMRIQCDYRVSSTRNADYTHRIAGCTVTQHSMQLGYRSEAMWRQSGLWIWIPDPHQIRIQVLVWRAPLSNAQNTHFQRMVNASFCVFPCIASRVYLFSFVYACELQATWAFQPSLT